MGYFDKDYLEHHQILGAKWGHKNGPPYPLGSGDHSSAEKKAASAAGVKVGSDSGKGSIENVKKSGGGSGGSSSSKTKKAPLTEEEKRLKAEEARLKGDSKNINKYMDKLTTDELRDAQTRAQIKKSLAEEKQSKADKEKKEAMLSGDKEKVKEYADKMSYYELQEAMNKVDLMQKLNYKPPEPTTMDKINSAMKKVDTARDWMQKGLQAYDALAAINNTFNKDHKWPRAEFGGNKNNDEKKKDSFENTAKKLIADAQNTKAQNDRKKENQDWNNTQNRRLDLEEKEFKFQQERYKDSKEAEARAEKKAADAKKEEAREAKKEERAEKNAEREAAREAKRQERDRELDDFYNGPEDKPSKSSADDSETTRSEIKNTYDSVKDKPMSSYKDDDYYDDYIDSVMTKYERSSGKQETLSDYYDDMQSNYRESTRRREESIKDQQETARAAREAKLQLRDATHEMATANTDAQRQKALDRLDYWQTVLTNNYY